MKFKTAQKKITAHVTSDVPYRKQHYKGLIANIRSLLEDIEQSFDKNKMTSKTVDLQKAVGELNRFNRELSKEGYITHRKVGV